MRSIPILRSVLQIIAIASIGVVAVQLVIAARNLEAPSNDAVRLAGLALPLLFAAFLNLIVWGQAAPKKTARRYTHFANGLLLVAAVLVMRAIPVTFAFVVTACAAALSIISFLFEITLGESPEAPA
jgi:hypothetical protein